MSYGETKTDTAIRDLQTLFEIGTPGAVSDAQLLDRFVLRQEAAVFETIVHRHGPMVWGVCRRVLRDHHDAEDAFQATFLVLARKAASVKPREKLGNWLYGVAYQTARKARAMRAKRRTRESQVESMRQSVSTACALRDPAVESLDRELSRLPEKYRIPIVLCELEGKTHREASEQLGWPVGTVSGRLSRAKAMLARRLSRQGVSLSAGALGVVLAQEAAGAGAGVPAQMAASTARAASLFAAGHVMVPGVVSLEVTALTKEVLNMMMLTKLKTVFLALFVVSVTGGAGLVHWAPAFGAPSPGPGERTEARGGPPERPQPVAARSPAAVALAQNRAAEPMASHPFKLESKDVVELPELTVDYGDFHLKTGPVSIVPISSEPGITGAMVIGKGTFRYTPKKETSIEGQFNAAMLRFNPAEQAAIVPLDKGKRVNDRGAAEMSRHMLQVVIRHCWQSTKDGGRRQEVLIPPKGAFAAVLYSREHGDLLISFDDRTATAFSFSDRKRLYEKP